MITFIDDDILKSECMIICHQTNCKGKMGAGIAKQIRQQYPKVYDEYVKFCKDNYKNLLGRCQIVNLSISNNLKFCANLFGQNGYGYGEKYTDYEALRCALNELKDNCYTLLKTVCDVTIGIPYNIGCGLAGGDWNTVFKIIEDIFKDEEHIHVKIYKL